MTAPTPYLFLPGTAREALGTYARVFGGDVEVHSLADLGRTDGPPDAVGHGHLGGGPVELFAADVTADDAPPRGAGVVLALLGTSTPADLRRWFRDLADGGTVLDDLQRRPWGASDGRVVDRFGVTWLVGFEGDDEG